MSRHDHDDPQRGPRVPDERRDPYEARRHVRTFGDEDEMAAEHPWRAAHPQQERGGTRSPRWSEQPARYGGGYREDELWSGHRGDARYGLDTDNERAYGQRQHQGGRHSHGQWQQPQRDYGRDIHGQDNSGYGAERSYGQGGSQDDARADYAHASWTQEHDYQGPRYGSGSRAGRDPSGDQYARTDTYGGAGFRQEGKRYWFDEGDQRGAFRGTRPRGYERSDERLRELACERLTEADLDASDIEVKVSQGTVTLEGSVPARWMKHQAEDIVDDLGSVKDIQNHLRVSQRDTTRPGTASSGGSPAPGSTGAAGGGLAPGSDTGARSRH
ncbi:MAG TPA: BON domain-containing protein [Frateuria sp.]|uniref:BON domain-containing protein n=1 Tax=Frateuria sp. TaxID=2211372 RepID=UPI002DF24B1D|nr:BON domain-containing protein [Frateuria sp.]